MTPCLLESRYGHAHAAAGRALTTGLFGRRACGARGPQPRRRRLCRCRRAAARGRARAQAAGQLGAGRAHAGAGPDARRGGARGGVHARPCLAHHARLRGLPPAPVARAQARARRGGRAARAPAHERHPGAGGGPAQRRPRRRPVPRAPAQAGGGRRRHRLPGRGHRAGPQGAAAGRSRRPARAGNGGDGRAARGAGPHARAHHPHRPRPARRRRHRPRLGEGAPRIRASPCQETLYFGDFALLGAGRAGAGLPLRGGRAGVLRAGRGAQRRGVRAGRDRAGAGRSHAAGPAPAPCCGTRRRARGRAVRRCA